jgi:lysophospholipase L1-like esterase
MRTQFLRSFVAMVGLAILGGCDVGSVAPYSDGIHDARWIGIWGTALHQPAAVAADTSLRMIVHPTLGADRIRVRFANPYGDAPVTFESIHAALRTTGPAVDADTDHVVTFAGADTLTLAPKTEAFSDPIDLAIVPGDDLAISFYVAAASTQSQHGASRAVSYLATGNHTDEADGSSFTSTATSWWSVIGIDAFREDARGTFVGFGDSITDGNEPSEANNRWPDYFATRLQGEAFPIGVLNAGIGANQVTRDTNFLGTSEAAVKRFDRDALQRPNVRWMVIFEGTNDLGGGVPAEPIFAALCQLAGRAHAHGVHVIAGTITPRGKDGTWPTNPALEEQRVKLNDLIRGSVDSPESGACFDELADFDEALRDPLVPYVMAAQYDSGDGLHPNPLGLQVIAETIPIEGFK